MSDQIKPPSDEAETLEEEISDDPVLGNPVKNYPSDRSLLLMRAGIVIGITGMILNVAFLPVEANIAFAFVVIGTAIIGLIAGWYVLHYWNLEVIMYEKGFSFREGSRVVYFRFDEVESLKFQARKMLYFGGLLRRIERQFVIRTVHDETMRLNNVYRNLDQLVEKMENAINPLLRDQLITKISNGYEVPFGEDIKLSSAGIIVNENKLLWDDFANYRVSEGQLIIASTSNDNWEAVPLTKIDNLTVLVPYLKDRRTSGSLPAQ